jgi:hypothetical protein
MRPVRFKERDNGHRRKLGLGQLLPSWKIDHFWADASIYVKTCNNNFAKYLGKTGLCLGFDSAPVYFFR